MLDEARSHCKFTFLFLFFLLLLLLFFGELARRFNVWWLPLGFDVCFLHMPLGQHDSRPMVDQTHCMDRIAILLFKLQSSPLCFSINRHRAVSSFLLLAVDDLEENMAKCCFNLFRIHSPKQSVDRALMGSYPVFKP